MSKVHDWDRVHYRNATKAHVVKENPDSEKNPWYVLMRWENSRGDSVVVGYADEQASQYVLALNGHAVERFPTKKAVREGASAFMRKLVPVDLMGDETSRNALISYVAAHNHEYDQGATKSDLRDIIETELEQERLYSLEEIQPEEEEEPQEA